MRSRILAKTIKRESKYIRLYLEFYCFTTVQCKVLSRLHDFLNVA